MSTATAAPAATQLTVNKFQLANHSGKTKVSYSPPEGPIVVGVTPKTPFSYSGPEGELSFTEGQITRDNTPLGTLWSVVLTQSATGSTTFAVLIPPVLGNGSHTIGTYAVKARKSASVSAGAVFTYEMEHLKGDAEFVRFFAR
jgi:hypothetical protein